MLIALLLALFIGWVFWFFMPLTYIKKDNVVIRLMGKRTYIPISEIRKIRGFDMMRGGYRITIFSKNGTYYGDVGMLEGFAKKIKKINPTVIVEEKSV